MVKIEEQPLNFTRQMGAFTLDFIDTVLGLTLPI